jgi:hypothetical protein
MQQGFLLYSSKLYRNKSVWNKFKKWMECLAMTPEERYLSESLDHCDFEIRLKRIEDVRRQNIRDFFISSKFY